MDRAARNRPAKPEWPLILLAAGSALAVAVLAVWLMAPRPTLAPVPVEPSDWFPADLLERADAFRRGQRWLAIGQLLAQAIFLVSLVFGPLAARLRRRFERLENRPALAGALISALILSLLQLIALPFSLVAHARSVEVGLSTQDTGAWLADWLLSTVIFVSIGALLLTGALFLARRFGVRWWIPGAVAVICFAVLMTWATPAVISPIFNDYQRLGPGAARSDVFELADAAGVEVGEVYRVDASRRTTGLNAFVDGIGSTKRVVLYDTLIDDLPAGERRSVVAHELAHAERNDIWRGLLWVAIVTPLAVLFVALFSARVGPASSKWGGSPSSLPALILAIAIALTVVQTVGNGLSRAVERNADLRALELTDAPRAMIALQRRLAESNLTQPDPPGWSQFLFGTHPTTDQRIGSGLAWERGERPR